EPYEAQDQVAFGVVLESAEVEAGAEVPAISAKHQDGYVLPMRRVDTFNQRFDEVGGKRVHFSGPVDRERPHTGLPLDEQGGFGRAFRVVGGGDTACHIKAPTLRSGGPALL